MHICEELKKRRLFFDGGMGSLLQEKGLRPGELPETWNLIHPEIIEQIHVDYLNAGADVVTTNTFGANRFKYKKAERDSVEEVVKAAVQIAKRAVKRAGHGFVALGIGPTGKLLSPYGTLGFEEACDVYKEVVRAGAAEGADLVIIETMGDSYELKAAVLAAKEESDLPVFATVTLDEKGKMLTGGNVESVTALLEGLDVDVIGLNCGLGPVQLLPFVENMCTAASVPVMVNPNAGLPRSEGGDTVYDIDSDWFADAMKKIALSGASILGGCCGTTPEHIAKMHAVCKDVPLPVIEKKKRTVVSSYSHVVEFGNRPIIIGERINPTGKPKLKQALKDHDMAYILNMGVEQQEHGADVLDVNVGLPGMDELELMTDVVKELQSVLDLPLQIDTANFAAMEHAMRIYNGKPLINSVNGRQDVMDAVFPLVKKYGGVAVALCLDENGIPETAEGRIAVAKKIYDTAEKYGIGREDILMDALCMAVGSDKNSALVTLETVRRIQEELGGKTVLGVSNVSFGLPMREYIHASFFLMALQNGLSAAIINPNSDAMMAAYDSFLVLSAQDENCSRYIGAYAQREAEKKEKTVKVRVQAESSALKKSIIRGISQDAEDAARIALESDDALTIIDREMIPALDEVGKGFENGNVFLPQLMMSAEAAKAAFAVIKTKMEANGQTQKKRGKIILATVKGDVHDIGKNIVKTLLENYCFEVIDLGYDVAPEVIASCAKQEEALIVGLSALMTTTVPAMEETIKLLRKEVPSVKVMVGGAVLTREYAEAIGADGYCKDAMGSVNFALSCEKSM